jgi:small subunit ribosomal protein S3
MGVDVEKVAGEAIDLIGEKIRNLNKLNIIVAGKTGVGKSTLINSVFRDNLAETGMGKPVTTHMRKITKKDVQINIYEVKRPELDAVIVANKIARQLEGKVAYRRAVKQAIASTMRIGAEGIKVQVSGRLNGAEMARKEMYKEGRTPLHTLRADIDYCHVGALTKVGLIGVKVWICRGEVYGKRDLAPQFSQKQDARGDRRGGRDGERRGFRRNKK